MGDNFGIHRSGNKGGNAVSNGDEVRTQGQILSDFLVQLEDYTPTVSFIFCPYLSWDTLHHPDFLSITGPRCCYIVLPQHRRLRVIRSEDVSELPVTLILFPTNFPSFQCPVDLHRRAEVHLRCGQRCAATLQDSHEQCIDLGQWRRWRQQQQQPEQQEPEIVQRSKVHADDGGSVSSTQRLRNHRKEGALLCVVFWSLNLFMLSEIQSKYNDAHCDPFRPLFSHLNINSIHYNLHPPSSSSMGLTNTKN